LLLFFIFYYNNREEIDEWLSPINKFYRGSGRISYIWLYQWEYFKHQTSYWWNFKYKNWWDRLTGVS
jgi:hypothetical protein